MPRWIYNRGNLPALTSNKKYQENRKMIFIDLEKDYDKVRRESIWGVLN